MINSEIRTSDFNWSVINYAYFSKKEKCCEKDCKDCPFAKKKKKKKKK